MVIICRGRIIQQQTSLERTYLQSTRQRNETNDRLEKTRLPNRSNILQLSKYGRSSRAFGWDRKIAQRESSFLSFCVELFCGILLAELSGHNKQAAQAYVITHSMKHDGDFMGLRSGSTWDLLVGNFEGTQDSLVRAIAWVNVQDSFVITSHFFCRLRPSAQTLPSCILRLEELWGRNYCLWIWLPLWGKMPEYSISRQPHCTETSIYMFSHASTVVWF